MYTQQCETDLNIERKDGQIMNSMNDVALPLNTDVVTPLILSSHSNLNGKMTEVTKCLRSICDEGGSSSVNIKADSNLKSNKLHLSKLESLANVKNICDSCWYLIGCIASIFSFRFSQEETLISEPNNYEIWAIYFLLTRLLK